MTECYLCKGPAEDTHHIMYQSQSNDNGFFETFHQNSKHNLIPLCKSCHNKEHNGDLYIKGYIKTSAGIQVDVEENINPVPEKNKVPDMTDNEISKLKMYIKRGKCNWFLRNTKTSTYKICTDESKINNKICKLLNRNIQMQSTIYDVLFDAMF